MKVWDVGGVMMWAVGAPAYHPLQRPPSPPRLLLLQEVDCFPLLQQHMSSLGYLSVFAARTGDRTDGCATFWQVAGGKAGELVGGIVFCRLSTSLPWIQSSLASTGLPHVRDISSSSFF